jgi:hypothetical protein
MLGMSALGATPLKVLDLSKCWGLTTADDCVMLEALELRLPGGRFAELTRRLLPGSRVEVAVADIGAYEAERLVQNLDDWGIDRLRIVSRRLEAPFEWRGVPKPRLEPVTNPMRLVAPSAVLLTSWRALGKRELKFLRSIDMSTLPLAEFPKGATLFRCSSLESAILPTGLRVLPEEFFYWCRRLSHVGTSSCTACEKIDKFASAGCRSLKSFAFPRTIREIGGCSFDGTAIEDADLSETVAESAMFVDMILLERLSLPRCCVLEKVYGVSALRSLTFGRAGVDGFFYFGSSVCEVRFEGFLAPVGDASGLVSARVHGEVAAVFTRQSNPSCPP